LVFDEPKAGRHSSNLNNQMMSDEIQIPPLYLFPIGIATDPTPSSPSGRASKAKQSRWLIPVAADKLHYYGTVQDIQREFIQQGLGSGCRYRLQSHRNNPWVL
jgi:hypothetical protein